MNPSSPRIQEPTTGFAVVFRGSKWLCHEYSLVLEARGIEHEVLENDGAWVLRVPASLLQRSYSELSSYARERGVGRKSPDAVQPHAGTAAGVVGYVLTLLLTAYLAGNQTFGADWLGLGALDPGIPSAWWRAVTALTLHLDQEHLLGNLLFGAVAGAAVSRLLGPGVAWATILVAAALANYTEILIAPTPHRAVGASTAVFAALGLLSGMAWRQSLSLRERLWYRWAPLIAGICLLTLLGTGNARVDVLGHGLGFCFGLAIGWAYIHTGIANYRGARGQYVGAVCAVLAVIIAWFMALR